MVLCPILHRAIISDLLTGIQCEYANGTTKWVIYRQLRDLISLHTHYRLSNAYNRNIDALPEFPLTSSCFGMTHFRSSIHFFLSFFRFTLLEISDKAKSGKRPCWARKNRICSPSTRSCRKLLSGSRPCGGKFFLLYSAIHIVKIISQRVEIDV